MRIEPLFKLFAPSAWVWRVGLDIDSAELERAYELLAIDEKERGARFAFPVHRRRYVAARAALREIIGEQLDIQPRDVVFRYTAEGKPELDGCPRLQFSVSHSADLCMIAVAIGQRLGIDVETTAVTPNLINEVAASFHPAEREALDLLDAPEKDAAFYRCWVRKEALLKALGVGLGGGLHRINVSLNEKASLIWSDPALTSCGDWSLISLDGAGYAAALAIESRPPQPVVLKPRRLALD